MDYIKKKLIWRTYLRKRSNNVQERKILLLLHISPASMTSWNILILLFPSCLLYSLQFIDSTVPLTVISQNLNFCISIFFFCKMGKIVLLTYKPIYIPYLCSYTCRTERLTRNQTSGSFQFWICKCLNWAQLRFCWLILPFEASLIWTVEFWQSKSHF